MALKIHGMWYSNASGRVLATLYEKEVQFELIPVDIMKGEQKAPAYLALQVCWYYSQKRPLHFNYLSSAQVIEMKSHNLKTTFHCILSHAACTFLKYICHGA